MEKNKRRGKMIDFKDIIAKEISNITNIGVNELKNYIEIPPVRKMGDYSFPCFKLAKELKKSPQMIAEDLKNKLNFKNNEISKIEVIKKNMEVAI